ncbi:D-alanine--D-alanine ligase family protein [Paenibacillus arenilitoris]|uniref:D-alanine--D-alanine ligase n=1 Tax=Paenibacillus arenilitoris TaxID=2772299 RepID=A0A927CKI5_9BACL|nr:D-alanine--D-alanine ligase family protein [Paenibacillus arenilitoris]MBD2869729.1 D-alanine--D-alanine ligase [Paenibacillus arenilitoris]
MRTKLIVLYGGKSVEHEVSLKTAYTVIQAIDETKFEIIPIYITREGLWGSLDWTSVPAGLRMDDLVAEPVHGSPAASIGDVLIQRLTAPGKKAVLPLLHGSNGEDGTVQGLLELLDVPYVGNGVLSSALTLDKAVSKQLLAGAGIRQTEFVSFRHEEWLEEHAALLDRLERRLGYPCYVKPASLGSSIGISRCESRRELQAGIEEALRYDGKIVVEREIAGREIQVAVLGNEKPLVSLPGEFIHNRSFFDFDSKYLDKSLTMSIPAQIPDPVTEQIRRTALHAYQALCCSGLARVDFFLDGDGALYLNEINALPGFTNFSMYPVMWERTDGTSYSELIEKLIDYAFTRHAEKQTIQYAR